MAKCKAIDRVIAKTRDMLDDNGKDSKLSFSLRLNM
jgi:hypothetical protein